ncbi:hypothetical protein PanWU01x14_063840 [Parasponia andersonii]|uniref:Uncharacterized protein n=1 Tax=Parasponia andersonii TaxID=3476 RepID=A0A2P5DH37_PARAD|nr:hypothetical protein PanWU01x14_063840 [Parasponia andersonii]
MKSRDGKRARNPSGVGEGDLGEIRIVDEDVGNGDLYEKLLALNPREPPHAPLLHEGRDLVVVRYGATDRRESVLLPLLLTEPDEAGGAVVADLGDVV